MLYKRKGWVCRRMALWLDVLPGVLPGVLLGVFLTAFAVNAHAQAALVIFTQGDAGVEKAGKFEPLQVGASIAEGALLRTGAGGYLYLKLADDGFFILRPKTQARIAAYRPVPERPAESEFRLELLEGVARAITGKVADQAKDRFRLNTPVAAIGVKGTDFVVSATADATYVSVYSGGVVASPFMAGCAREGLGQCKSTVATTMLASPDGLLEVKGGTQNVQLLDLKSNPALRQLTPDQIAPPANNEGAVRTLRRDTNAAVPVSVTSAATSGAAPTLALAENPNTTSSILGAARLLSGVTMPVIEPPTQKIFWGRYAEVANLPKGVDLAEFMKGLDPIGLSWPSYVVARNKDPMSMPSAGMMSFNLTNSESGIFLNNNTSAAIAAQIVNPTLSVDFGSRAFATQLTVVGGGYKADFVANGTVQANGLFEANAGRSNMTLSGGLAGSPVDQSAYIFSGRIDSNAVASGATFWRRAP